MQIYAKIWTRYAKICNKNMQKYAVKYAKYAEVHILHILLVYAFPTLLMPPGLVSPGRSVTVTNFK